MIVAEYTTAAGVHIAFADDAYAGCSEEELERRREHIRRTAWWCWARANERRKQNAPEGGSLESALPGAATADAAQEKVHIGDAESIAQTRRKSKGGAKGT